jgi:hypothetical protein
MNPGVACTSVLLASLFLVGCSATTGDDTASAAGAATASQEWLIACTAPGGKVHNTRSSTEPTDQELEEACPTGQLGTKAPWDNWIITCDLSHTKTFWKPTAPTMADLERVCPDDFQLVSCSGLDHVRAVDVAGDCPGETAVYCGNRSPGDRVIVVASEKVATACGAK